MAGASQSRNRIKRRAPSRQLDSRFGVVTFQHEPIKTPSQSRSRALISR